MLLTKACFSITVLIKRKLCRAFCIITRSAPTELERQNVRHPNPKMIKKSNCFTLKSVLSSNYSNYMKSGLNPLFGNITSTENFPYHKFEQIKVIQVLC